MAFLRQGFCLYVESMVLVSEQCFPTTRISVRMQNHYYGFLRRAFLPQWVFGLNVESILWVAEESVPPTRISFRTSNQYYGLRRKVVFPQRFGVVRSINTVGYWGGHTSHNDFGLYVELRLWASEEGIPFRFVRRVNTVDSWRRLSPHKDLYLYVESKLWIPEEGCLPTRIADCT